MLRRSAPRSLLITVKDSKRSSRETMGDRKEPFAMKVRSVMHTGVTWVEPQTPLDTIAKKMHTEDIGAVPVGENDRLIGMVTDRDICCRGIGNGRRDVQTLAARDVMSKPILYCREDDDLEMAVRTMKKGRVRRLPVINAKKRMVGMLSLGDVASKGTREVSASALKTLAAHHA